MTRVKPILTFIAMSLALASFYVRPAFAFDTTAQYGILIDGPTGAVLWEKDGDVRMHPASMS
jgi:D-alanyl-D-alanine carboxypeptidase (penicillin-binding protein 5/6)